MKYARKPKKTNLLPLVLEILLIVAQSQYKKAIMQAIGEACGFHSDAHGLVISLPVEDAIGLKAPEDDGAHDAIDMK